MDDAKDFKCILCGNHSCKFIKDYNGTLPFFSGLKIIECNSCGHRTVLPCLSNSNFTDYYKNDYVRDDECESKKHDVLIKLAASRVEFIIQNTHFNKTDKLRILDIGAGFGHIGQELCSRFKDMKFIYDAVEINQKAVEYLSIPENKVNNVFADLKSVKNSKYDLIILSHILEHFSDPISFLNDIIKKMSNTGFLFVEVPNEYSLWRERQQPHLQFFSPDTLEKFLTRSGLCIYKVTTCGELIEDCVVSKELKKNHINKSLRKELKSRRLDNADCYGGDRRWIRGLFGAKKKVLFLMLYPVYFRNFEPIIRELGRRGYSIHLIFNDLTKYYKEGVKEIIDTQLKDLSREYPDITYDILNTAPHRKSMKLLACKVRAFCDYIRYLNPKYSFMNSLRTRCRKKFFSVFIVFADVWYRWLRNVSILSVVYQVMEIFLGIPKNIREFIRKGEYDAVFVTPLVNIGSEQVDYIKAAKSLKVPCVLTVHSWDNLTNKGSMRILPNRICVWNKYQVEEANAVHGMPKENVIVTGAQCYDHWFERKPTLGLKDFCQIVGLQSHERFLLYLGSSKAIAPFEVSFVEQWVKTIRNCADEHISKMPIIIRPHPQNVKQWEDAKFKENNVVIYPRAGKQTIGEEAKQEYFHSLYYSEAAIGINTSAMIEASILKKPIFTILDESFKASQEETYHFRYLKSIGPVYSSNDLIGHVKQLTHVFANPTEAELKNEKFMAEFIRPYGSNKKATDIFADEIGAFLHDK